MSQVRSLRFIAVCTVAATVCFAQNSGIQGVISDSTGGVIPAANVTVVNVATGVEYEAQSNETGLYSVPFLSPGTYTLTARTEGFAPSTRENLKLDVQQIARVDFTLSREWTSPCQWEPLPKSSRFPQRRRCSSRNKRPWGKSSRTSASSKCR